jgi:tRNA (guanine37-N1)-methyltransferase
MWFGVVTLFPEMLQALDCGVTGRGLKSGLLSLESWNPRDFTHDKHSTVDAKPYGGGPGMLMLAQPIRDALLAARKAAPTAGRVVYLSPQGQAFDQKAAAGFAEEGSVILLAGRYEGIDQRLLESEIDEEWSIGDYVLSGGELPAMVMIDAISRLIPGVVKEEDSVSGDSLSSGLLKYPQFTRPEDFEGRQVPEVLLSGNHKVIEDWRLKQSLGNTWSKRPDLLEKKTLNAREQQLLQEFINEQQQTKI